MFVEQLKNAVCLDKVGKTCAIIDLEREIELCNIGTRGPLSWLVGLAQHAEGQILCHTLSEGHMSLKALLKSLW